MDLTKEGEERLKPNMVFNPAKQYFAQVVSHKIAQKADDGQQPLPEMNPDIVEYVRPDKEHFKAAAEEISAFDDQFEL